MNKFNIGDIVIGNEKADRYEYTTIGTKCKVVSYELALPLLGDIRVEIMEGLNKGRVYTVRSECFDLYTPHQGKILIMVDEKDPNKVVARDLITGKKTEAKCNPKDEWDFEKGAKLAFNRLYPEPEKKEEKKPWTGDLVCIESNSMFFTVGKIYHYDGLHFEDDSLTPWYFVNYDVKKLNDYFSSRGAKFIEYKGGLE